MDLNFRLDELNKIPGLPAAEIEAAEVVLERLITARSICISLFGAEPAEDSPVLGAVLAELGSSVRWIMENDRRRFSED